MITLRTVTEIQASAACVWRVLTDFASYPAWNPFLRTASGVAQVGARLRLSPQLAPGLRLVFRPVVTVCTPGRELRWRGQAFAAWLGRGEHVFLIEPQGEGRVRLEQRETFAGALPPLLGWLVTERVRRGFAAMNEALRVRAEAHDGA